MTVVYISDIETLVKAKMEIDELQIKNEEVEEKSKLEEFVNKYAKLKDVFFDKGKIILDPGVGFAKDLEQNIIVMKELDRLNEFNLPILLGTSRKSVIGLTLDLPKDERVEGTLVTTVLAVIKGCMFVRVHDVKENVRAIKMAEALFK